MKLFYVIRNDISGYDEYSDFVCAAENEEEAKRMHPNEVDEVSEERKHCDSWVSLSELTVIYLGEATEGIKEGIICASFHAG